MKSSYTIKLDSGGSTCVTGEVVNGIWGIDKRETERGRQQMKDGTERILYDKDYIITHIPTGAKLPFQFRTLKAAKMLLQEPEFFFDELNQESIHAMWKAIARFFDDKNWKD